MPGDPNAPEVMTAVKKPAVQTESSQTLPVQGDSLDDRLADSLVDTLADPLAVQFDITAGGADDGEDGEPDGVPGPDPKKGGPPDPSKTPIAAG